jgi:thiazole/oxazole-forming peptide maturase SagD family component
MKTRPDDISHPQPNYGFLSDAGGALPEAHPLVDKLIRQDQIFASVPRVRKKESDPSIYCHTCLPGKAVEELGDLGKYTRCGGAGFTRSASWISAAGEGLERYYAVVYSQTAAFRYGTWADHPAESVHPRSWPLFSAGQYEGAGFPYRLMTEDTKVKWYPGHDLASGEAAWLPGPMVCFPYLRGDGEERVAASLTTGLAFGLDRLSAYRSALWEVIERDSLVLAWHWQLPVRKIDPSTGLCHELARRSDLDERFTVHAYDISSDLGIPVCMVFLRLSDPSDPILAVGAACRGSLTAALEKAFLEALQGVPYVRHLRDTMSGKPFSSDFTNVRSFERSAAFYSLFPDILERYLAERADFLNVREHVSIPAEPIPAPLGLSDLGLSDTVAALGRRGYRPYAVDMTGASPRDAGCAIVRVTVPGLYGLEGTYRYRNGDITRALHSAAHAGAAPSPNPYPHPLP